MLDGATYRDLLKSSVEKFDDANDNVIILLPNKVIRNKDLYTKLEKLPNEQTVIIKITKKGGRKTRKL